MIMENKRRGVNTLETEFNHSKWFQMKYVFTSKWFGQTHPQGQIFFTLLKARKLLGGKCLIKWANVCHPTLLRGLHNMILLDLGVMTFDILSNPMFGRCRALDCLCRKDIMPELACYCFHLGIVEDWKYSVGDDLLIHQSSAMSMMKLKVLYITKCILVLMTMRLERTNVGYQVYLGTLVAQCLSGEMDGPLIQRRKKGIGFRRPEGFLILFES